jgi:hypothetical protein
LKHKRTKRSFSSIAVNAQDTQFLQRCNCRTLPDSSAESSAERPTCAEFPRFFADARNYSQALANRAEAARIAESSGVCRLFGQRQRPSTEP